MGSPAMNEPSVTASRAYSPEVMVSYSSHDRPQVMQFVQRLRAAGVAAWIDQGGIDGAQRWGEEIVNAIDSCKTVLLMISQTSMQSENIAKEVMLAWENNKHFLPLCLEDAKIAKSMQYQLAGIQQIKLYEGDPEAKFVAVLRALVRLGVHVSPYYIALVSADLGEREQAFEWLERACEQRSSSLAQIKDRAAVQRAAWRSAICGARQACGIASSGRREPPSLMCRWCCRVRWWCRRSPRQRNQRRCGRKSSGRISMTGAARGLRPARAYGCAGSRRCSPCGS